MGNACKMSDYNGNCDIWQTWLGKQANGKSGQSKNSTTYMLYKQIETVTRFQTVHKMYEQKTD